jgi:hypothetical protein
MWMMAALVVALVAEVAQAQPTVGCRRTPPRSGDQVRNVVGATGHTFAVVFALFPFWCSTVSKECIIVALVRTWATTTMISLMTRLLLRLSRQDKGVLYNGLVCMWMAMGFR